MRFCLSCRSLSGGGPLCTQCGRSFGGRLCQGKKKHLNPPDARLCNYCGTDKLYEGATSIPLGWVSRIVILVFIFFVGRWLLLCVTGASTLSFKALTGYQDVRIWLIEKFAHLLIILLVFSFISSFIPGEAGKWFRATMFGLVGKAITLVFKIGEQVLRSTMKLLFRFLGAEEHKSQN